MGLLWGISSEVLFCLKCYNKVVTGVANKV